MSLWQIVASFLARLDPVERQLQRIEDEQAAQRTILEGIQVAQAEQLALLDQILAEITPPKAASIEVVLGPAIPQ